jgi:hypothetical protein
MSMRAERIIYGEVFQVDREIEKGGKAGCEAAQAIVVNPSVPKSGDFFPSVLLTR